MRVRRVLSIAAAAVALAGCPPPAPNHPQGGDDDATAPTGGGGGPGETTSQPVAAQPPQPPSRVVDQASDFAFDGGRIDFELRQTGDRVVQSARNRFMVPIVMQWTAGGLVNLAPEGASEGVVVLPAADKPDGLGPLVELGTFDIEDRRLAYRRELTFRARFGDPTAKPDSYVYALPFRRGQTYSVLQGPHGLFSHRGSNEYAVDFACPVATNVLATRPGIVVAANASAIGSGTTPEFWDFHRVNFVLVLHDDGTLGEYMHLSPSGVVVQPGQHVARGELLALSGNTGYSSTPHLHFQVMTAANDGIAAHSFPFELAVSSTRAEAPATGRTYTAWE